MRESWTDARLDDFRQEVGRRFDQVEGELRMQRRLDGARSRVSSALPALCLSPSISLRIGKRRHVG
jgi:hypothetical protein